MILMYKEQFMIADGEYVLDISKAKRIGLVYPIMMKIC